jgi:hypothetical protein
MDKFSTCAICYSWDKSHFFSQGADIELISRLVNKKAAFQPVNRLKKFAIAKYPLSCGRNLKNRIM